jgi:hypothetical protein
MFVFFPAEVSADDRTSLFTGENVPLEELQTILDSPDFGGEKDSWDIRFKRQRERTDIPYTDINFDPQLIFAYILRIFIIALIGAAVVFLFIFARKIINKKNHIGKKSLMTALHGIPPENSDALLEKSLDFYKQGELRLAWGYCTAAVIQSWQLHRGIVFPADATESDCASMVNTQAGDYAEIKKFDRLVKYWINFAYAGKNPPPESFNEAVCFCKSLRTLTEHGR